MPVHFFSNPASPVFSRGRRWKYRPLAIDTQTHKTCSDGGVHKPTHPVGNKFEFRVLKHRNQSNTTFLEFLGFSGFRVLGF
jgi:hypothetical protein